jgi:hypothetical protein
MAISQSGRSRYAPHGFAVHGYSTGFLSLIPLEDHGQDLQDFSGLTGFSLFSF